jgi:hypothetical protein
MKYRRIVLENISTGPLGRSHSFCQHDIEWWVDIRKRVSELFTFVVTDFDSL